MGENLESNRLEELVERLKVRLEFAKFKCRHGYEKVDLYTLESSIYQYKTDTKKRKVYPKIDPKNKSNCRKLCLKSYKTLPPLSEKRSISVEESTAELLLWMYQHGKKNI
ncbi:unnamed protein product [Cunninghamella echinulata]